MYFVTCTWKYGLRQAKFVVIIIIIIIKLGAYCSLLFQKKRV